VQDAVDRQPTRQAAVQWEGVGTIEGWTAPFNRDGSPEKVFLAIRTPDDLRTLAVISDATAAEVALAADIAGAKVAVRSDGTATLR
jgi:acetyl-CoA C-acetyltransferase